MAKTVTVLGNVRFEPPNAGPGSSRDFDLSQVPGLSITRQQGDVVDLEAGTPLVLDQALPASVVCVRVPGNASVDLVLSSASGSAQKVPVTGTALLASPGAPYTAVLLVSATDVSGVEYAVGG